MEPIRFELERRETSFDHGSDVLVGDVVASPLSGSDRVVVFVEGSGPGGRDQGSRPVGLAGCGLDSLAYDKPGSGASTGDWRAQSIESRASETAAAVAHCHGLGYRQVVLLGGSQGGWVARLAATMTSQVDAVVTVSGPAVGPEAQERFRLRTQLPADGFSPSDVDAAVALFDRRVRGCADGATGEEIWRAESDRHDAAWYRHLAGSAPAEIDLVGRLLTHDPRPALRSMSQPLLSVFGGADVLVDVAESVEIIRRERTGADDLVVVFPDADHSLRRYTGEGTPQFEGGHYEPGAPTPGVTEVIGHWINRVLR